MVERYYVVDVAMEGYDGNILRVNHVDVGNRAPHIRYSFYCEVGGDVVSCAFNKSQVENQWRK